jgi:hypothetical protein
MAQSSTAPDGSLPATPKQRGGVTGRGWLPGRSGNPRGRAHAPIDIAALAREHGPKCIEVVAQLLTDKDKRLRLAAAQTLLDRGFGRAPATLSVDGGADYLGLHLLAARSIATELRAEREAGMQTPLIEATNASAEHPDLYAPALE